MTTTTLPEIKLPVWLCQEKDLPRHVSPLRIKQETKDAYLLDLGHVIRASDNCHRCGRRIPNAVSALVGFGPDCCELLGIPRPMTVADAEATLEALQQQLGKQTFTVWVPKRYVSPDLLVGVPREAGSEHFTRDGHTVRMNQGGAFEVLFPYSADLVSAVKQVPGARFQPNTRSWTVPISSTAQLAKFAADNHFNIDPAVADRLTQVETAPVEPKRIVRLDGDKLAFQFDYSQRTKDALKDAGARWNGERGDFNKSIWLLPLNQANATRALQLVEEHGFTLDNNAAKALADLASAWTRSVRDSVAETADDFILNAHLNGSLRPYQVAGVKYGLSHMTPGKGVLIGDQMGLGKALPNSESVTTPFGPKPMGEIRVGDVVTGQNGKPTKVVGVYPQGEQSIVRVSFSDGTSVRCTWDHLWNVQHVRNDTRFGKWRTLTVREIVDAGLSDAAGNYSWRIPMVEPVEFAPVVLPVEAYTLGVLLGNGNFRDDGGIILTGDRDIADALNVAGRHAPHASEGISEFHVQDANLRHAVRDLGLRGKRSHEKVVPSRYLRAAPEQRLALLQGLMDTDGYAMPDGGAEFCSTSIALVDAVVELVQSLGGIARGRREAKASFTYEGETRQGKPAERINVKLPSPLNLFRGRKAALYRVPTKYQPTRIITSVVEEGIESATCIKVAADDGLLVAGPYVVTHNTIEAIAMAAEIKALPVLVITTASTKFNWRNEFQKWVPQFTTAVLGGAKGDQGDPNTAQIVVLNYDILGKSIERLERRGFKMLILDELQKIKNGDVAMICECGDQKHNRRCPEEDCDCRYFQPQLTENGKAVWQYKTKRVRLVERLAKQIPFKIGLSGTPIKNRPAEFVSILDILGRIRDFGGPKQFKDRYCDPQWDGYATTYDGATNLDELNTKLRGTCYLRREKDQVLKELPPKTRQFVDIELSNRAEYNALESVYADMIANSTGQDAAHLVRITELKQACARGKLQGVKEWLETFFEQEEHLVLFCWHRETANLLAKEFKAPMIVGETPLAKRQQIVDDFQAGKHRLLVANIQAGGEGITLTRSNNVAFVELAWTPADHEQAEDRCHRFGQQDNVTAYYLLASETIDDENWNLISEKWDVVNRALIGAGTKQGDAIKAVEAGILARVAARRGLPKVKEEYAF